MVYEMWLKYFDHKFNNTFLAGDVSEARYQFSAMKNQAQELECATTSKQPHRKHHTVKQYVSPITTIAFEGENQINGILYDARLQYTDFKPITMSYESNTPASMEMRPGGTVGYDCMHHPRRPKGWYPQTEPGIYSWDIISVRIGAFDSFSHVGMGVKAKLDNRECRWSDMHPISYCGNMITIPVSHLNGWNLENTPINHHMGEIW